MPLLLLCTSAMGQDYPKQTIAGRDYYIYTVEPGNTLFGIARSFSADINAIKVSNPGAAEGLEIGREIRVPLDAIDKREARRSDVKTDGDYLLHTVQRKESLFSISRLYGLTAKDIAELNPESAEVLSTGTVLRIPVLKSTSVKEAYLEPARNDTFMVHQVAAGETAYSIAKAYGLPLDSLLKANPAAKEVLRTDAWIVIPKYKESYREQQVSEQVKSGRDNSYTVPSGSLPSYNIAMLLPFELHLNDSIVERLRQGQDLNVLTEISLEFYRGARLALDSLEKLGFRAEVSFLELGDDLVSAREMVRRRELTEANLVIGPMHKTSIAVVSEHSIKNQIYLVSPNSFTNEVFGDNPYLFRPAASRETMLKYLANFVAINHRNNNVLMVSSESPKDWPNRKLFKQYYNESLGTFPNSFRDSVATITRKSVSADNAPNWLRKDTLNVLVIPSNEPAFISDFITRLIALSRQGYRIQVYGLDQWVKFDNIEAEYKNQFNLRLVVPNHIDYQEERVIQFLEKFRDEYQSEPTRMNYGFLGYDITMFFGKALMEHGMGFSGRTDNITMDGVMGGYRFGRSSTGKDFENKSVLIIEYNDFALKRVN